MSVNDYLYACISLYISFPNALFFIISLLFLHMFSVSLCLSVSVSVCLSVCLSLCLSYTHAHTYIYTYLYAELRVVFVA